MKTLIQLAFFVFLFFGLWFLLNKVEWTDLLKIKQVNETTEEKLGEIISKSFEASNTEIRDEKVIGCMDSLITKICVANHIEQDNIKLHVIKSDEINAFTLPANHLVINSGLILACENEGELLGVIGHEIAHMQLKHVMRKLVKELGLTFLISITTGKGGTEGVKELARMLSSSAYDRTLEKEADLKAVEYLKKARLNPEPFAEFLYRLGDKENENIKYLSWVNTHPDSKERAVYITEAIGKQDKKFKSVLTQLSWEKLKDYLKEE